MSRMTYWYVFHCRDTCRRHSACHHVLNADAVYTVLPTNGRRVIDTDANNDAITVTKRINNRQH